MTKAYTLHQEGATSVLTLIRAHCLNSTGKHELTQAMAEAGQDDAVRAIILAATHPQAWTVDVAELAEMQPDEAKKFSQAGQALADTIARLPVPVIAAVDAPALGGGCELVLACDLAIAGESARFGQIEAMGGVIPAFGGTWRLARRVGFQRALEMIFTAESVDASTAKMIGLVIDTVPSSCLLDRAREIAGRVARVSRQSLAKVKQVIHTGTALRPEAINQLEQETFASLFGTEDQRTRMRAFVAQSNTAQRDGESRS